MYFSSRGQHSDTQSNFTSIHLLSNTSPINVYLLFIDQIVSVINILLQFYHFRVIWKGDFKQSFFFVCSELYATHILRLCCMWIVSQQHNSSWISPVFLTAPSSCFISDRVSEDDASSRFKLQSNPVYYINQSRDPSRLSWAHQTDNTDRDQCTIHPRCVSVVLLLGEEDR